MTRTLGIPALLGLTVLFNCGLCRQAPADESAAPSTVRLGFEGWPDDGAAEAGSGGAKLRLIVAAPDPKAVGARRRFNVRSAGSVPMWGWKPGRYQDLWS